MRMEKVRNVKTTQDLLASSCGQGFMKVYQNSFEEHREKTAAKSKLDFALVEAVVIKFLSFGY